MTKDELIAENARMREALRKIAFKTLSRKLLKNPPPAYEYWRDFFERSNEWADWMEDIGEIANQAIGGE